MTFFDRLAARQRLRRTDLPASSFERGLVCTRCGALVAVMEARLGATSDADHQHLDPETYACGECLESGTVPW